MGMLTYTFRKNNPAHRRGTKSASSTFGPRADGATRTAEMVEIEEMPEDNLSELSVTQLKKRMKERGIDASGCTEVPLRCTHHPRQRCTPTSHHRPTSHP